MFIAASIILLSGVLFWASYDISLGVYVRSLCRKHGVEREVALTFDDGPDADMTPRALDLLREFNARATFFIIGEKASEYPDIVRRIVAEGHSIGIHSYSHKWNFPLRSAARIAEDIERCGKELEEITGERVRLFRPPFGVTNPMVGRAVRRTGVISVGWSIRSFDTIKGDRRKVARRVSRQLHDGAVVLLHDNRPGADELLESILCELKERGMRTRTIEELFNLNS